jgi:hypothetical protein
MKSVATIAVLLGSMTLSVQPVAAQTAPISRVVPIAFAGVVADDVTNTIKIRQPDGTYANFTGPVPDYPYKKGDAVTISFNATLPTKAFYDPASGAYKGQIAADGIYRIGLSSPAYNGGGGPGGVGNLTVPDVSGSINPAPNFGQPTNARMTIVYDSNADSYSIDFAPNTFIAGQYTGPGFTYDATSSSLSNCYGSACGPEPENNQNFGLNGNATSVSTSNIGIFGTAAGTGPGSGSGAGLFSLLFNGSWNLPTWKSGSGGSTEVPEPGMAVLFGSSALALLMRRRKRVVA